MIHPAASMSLLFRQRIETIPSSSFLPRAAAKRRKKRLVGQRRKLSSKEEGKGVKNKQLYRPSAESTFKMSLDGLGRSFIIARQQMTNLSVLDHQGEPLFEKDFVTFLAFHI